MSRPLINFRAIQGFAASGGNLRSETLYRSGHFGGIAPGAIPPLTELAFATIVDLRYAGERAAAPSPWPAQQAIRVVSHNGDRSKESPHLELLRTNTLTERSAREFYLSLYRDLPFDPLYRELFVEAVRRIGAQGGRTLVHCSAGKDRTGILCALILALLGVSEQNIMTDYLASRHAVGFDFIKQRIRERVGLKYGYVPDSTALDALLGVEAEFIGAAFEAIAHRSGSIANYFEQSGLEQAELVALRSKLIEPT